VFGNDGLAYDYWAAFVAWDLDLADLKQLALNSLRFSAVDPAVRAQLIADWQLRWQRWIDGLAMHSTL
jgi:adenosine deaminase CECR1